MSDQITQLDIGSSQKVKSPKYINGAHQTRAKADTDSKNNIIAVLHNLNLRKYYVEIDGQRYPRDSVLVNYEQNDYIDQYKELNLFFRENIGEEIMTPFISYLDMKTIYPIEVIDLRHQHKHITPKKVQLFHEYGADPENANFFLMIIRRREKELISDGNRLIEVRVI